MHRIVPDDDVVEQTTALASRLACGPTAAFVAVEELIPANAGALLDGVLDREAGIQRSRLGTSTDHRAAAEAFLPSSVQRSPATN